MTTTVAPFTLSHLDELESEAIHIMREVAAERERPVLLFSGGKDSIVLLRLAEKAFRPGGFPFPVMHVDTGHNFPEVIEFRDRRVAEMGERLVVAHLEDSIARGTVRLAQPLESRNGHQSVTLLEAIDEHRFDCLIGGARRDPKGLYRAAFAGEIDDFTGVSAPYEEPSNPEVRIDTTGVSPNSSAQIVLEALERMAVLA